MQDKIQLYFTPTVDVYGKIKSPTSFTNERVRLVFKISVIKDKQGEDVQVDGYGLIDSKALIEIDKKFIFESVTYRIIAYGIQKSMNANHHIKFYFKNINE